MKWHQLLNIFPLACLSQSSGSAFCGNYLLGNRATFQTERRRPTLWHMEARISEIVTRAECDYLASSGTTQVHLLRLTDAAAVVGVLTACAARRDPLGGTGNESGRYSSSSSSAEQPWSKSKRSAVVVAVRRLFNAVNPPSGLDGGD